MESKKKTRCAFNGCKKKIGLLGFECKCGNIYCSKHRHAEDHECTYDHKSKERNILENKLVKVVSEKIAVI
tara:strand:+ start:31978 stop:32190 length:213 start_codon:yes stop_codon:yes gene_type:complete